MRGRSGGGGAVCERRTEGERKRGESLMEGERDNSGCGGWPEMSDSDGG